MVAPRYEIVKMMERRVFEESRGMLVLWRQHFKHDCVIWRNTGRKSLVSFC